MDYEDNGLYQRLTRENVPLKHPKDVGYARLLMLMIKRVLEEQISPHSITRHHYLSLHIILANKLSEAYAKGTLTPRDQHFARTYEIYRQRIEHDLHPEKPIPEIYKPWTSKHIYQAVYCFATLYAFLHRVNLFMGSFMQGKLMFFTKYMPYFAVTIFALEFIFDIGIAVKQAVISLNEAKTCKDSGDRCGHCDRTAVRKGFMSTMNKDDRLHRLLYFFILGLNSGLQLLVEGQVYGLNLFILSGLDLLHLALPDFKSHQACRALCEDMAIPDDAISQGFEDNARQKESSFIQGQLKKEMKRLKRSMVRYTVSASCVAIGIIIIAASPSHSPGHITGGAITLFMGIYATKKRFRSAQKQLRRLGDTEIELNAEIRHPEDASYVALSG